MFQFTDHPLMLRGDPWTVTVFVIVVFIGSIGVESVMFKVTV